MLAINGGSPVRDSRKFPWPPWPVWGSEEKQALAEVIDSGVWSYNGPKETEFIKRWQEFLGVNHALLVANGTVAIQLALESVGVGVGDEVIVPALTWQATAGAVIDINATPILVDVLQDTWCIDPKAAEAAITPRTRAIIPVHLYGNMADMDAINQLAEKHGLTVIEDAAHKHGAAWNGTSAGGLGDIGCFSMQLSKILTAGEGGAIVTNDRDLWYKLDALRNCGRRPTNVVEDKGSGEYGEEGDLIQSGNYRITEFQAAVLLTQLARLEAQNRIREQNARYLDRLLSEIPGVAPMRTDPRETKKSYFNYAFRIDESIIGASAVRFRAALETELGIGVNACYQPLNDCSLYRPRSKSRHHLSEEYWQAIDPSRFCTPEATRAFHHTSVAMPHRVLMGSTGDMDQIGEAVRKVIDGATELQD